MLRLGLRLCLLVALGLVGLATSAHATLIQIGPGAFTGTATLVDYGLIQTFAPIDGRVFSGVLHNFTVGGGPSLDALIDSGPGDTNHIQVANIEGDGSGVMSLLFPGLQNRMAYGWATNTSGGVVGTTVQLFDGANVSLGSLSLAGAPDPTFDGGFLGVESSVAFARAEITFSGGDRFAFDNLQFEPVPEPGSLLLLGTGALGLALRRLRRRSN